MCAMLIAPLVSTCPVPRIQIWRRVANGDCWKHTEFRRGIPHGSSYGRLKVHRGHKPVCYEMLHKTLVLGGLFGATEGTETGKEIRNLECQILLYERFPAKQTRELVKSGFMAVQEVKWEKKAAEQITRFRSSMDI